MLPEGKDARALFVEIRDYKSRWRRMRLQSLGGDWEAFHRYVMDDLAYEAESAGFMEVFDFATDEQMLTPDQVEAGMVALEALARFKASLGITGEVAA